MPTVTEWGFVDGEPAKIVRNAQNGKVDLYWGGRGAADGPGHNHAVVNTSNPHAVRFIRIGGQVVADDRHPENMGRFQRDLAARGGWLGVFRTAMHNALKVWGIGGGGSRNRRRW